MRLLQRSSDGTLSHAEFFGDGNTPQYAILSHRWKKDEPNYQDIVNGTGKDKDGYAKLHFCGWQAEKDGLDYFWVDTVCIDKSSSAELTEAVNSMFRWYANSSQCYVYMSDVADFQRDFEAGEWFTRGWTLQELLAPKTVSFYSALWDRLGDKKDLENKICKVTGISRRAIRGEALSTFTVEERMAWVGNRVTTRIEDKAYCLMGIFDIFMPIIYGEGTRAFARLNEEIQKYSTDNLRATRSLESWNPKKVYNDGYNCFMPVTIKFSFIYGTGKKRLVKCSSCHYRMNTPPAHLKDPPILRDGRPVPVDILLARFHHAGDDYPTAPDGPRQQMYYRCFICKNGEDLDWLELKTHLESGHTYEQICSPDLRRSRKSAAAGGSTPDMSNSLFKLPDYEQYGAPSTSVLALQEDNVVSPAPSFSCSERVVWGPNSPSASALEFQEADAESLAPSDSRSLVSPWVPRSPSASALAFQQADAESLAPSDSVSDTNVRQYCSPAASHPVLGNEDSESLAPSDSVSQNFIQQRRTPPGSALALQRDALDGLARSRSVKSTRTRMGQLRDLGSLDNTALTLQEPDTKRPSRSHSVASARTMKIQFRGLESLGDAKPLNTIPKPKRSLRNVLGRSAR